jgi:cell division protein FtsB
MFIINFLKNKYFIVSMLFLVWVFFFAQYDLLSLYKQRDELNGMKQKIDYLEKEVAQLKQQKELLKNDKATLEKYAREKYYMKSPNEEVYVFDTIHQVKIDTIKP